MMDLHTSEEKRVGALWGLYIGDALAPAVLAAKAGKPAKTRKPKLVRHKVTLPEIEYDQLAVLKKRIASLGGNVKRSELMRGGLSLLAALGDAELAFVMTAFGRPRTRRRVNKARSAPCRSDPRAN